MLGLTTVAEAIGDEPMREQPVTPLVLPVLPGTPELPAPGIHFGLPEDLYHALPALSSHGIKKLASSPMLFWAGTTWLSEKRRKAEAERAAEERTHQTIGKAYHCRILEGREAFDSRFAVELSVEECEGALESTDQIKAAILEAGRKPYAKAEDFMPDTGAAYMRPARKADWIAQLAEVSPETRVLDTLRAAHKAANEGKTFIAAEAFEQIEIAARMIEADPELRHAFRDGYPEVTLIWTCPQIGVPMKCRADFLKVKACVDLKTIVNQRERSLENAIRFEIASYNYNVQPAVYEEGIQEVRKLVRERGHDAVFVHDETDDETARIDDAHSWALKWAKADALEWLWVFQQKGDAPVTRGVFYPLQGTTHMVTRDIALQQKRRFRACAETFGLDPWLDIRPIYDLADEDLPQSATDI